MVDRLDIRGLHQTMGTEAFFLAKYTLEGSEFGGRLPEGVLCVQGPGQDSTPAVLVPMIRMSSGSSQSPVSPEERLTETQQ